MPNDFEISLRERDYLRELAKKYRGYADLPIMEDRRKLWYAHNSLKGERPVIVIEMGTFEGEMLPACKCTSAAAREIETNLMRGIINHEMIDDDKVLPQYYTIFWNINIKQFGIDIKREYAEDRNGRILGFKDEYPIRNLREDFGILKSSGRFVDREYTNAWKNFVEETIGDILPVKIKNNSIYWLAAPTMLIVGLMGMENMLFSMIDYPDEMHALFDLTKNDIIATLRWMEDEKLLPLNNGNDYSGAGSYGFTNELPTDECIKTGHITTKDLWGNMNSQESVGISPDMFGEFVFPAYRDLANEFGLTYYGCCEAVHHIWKDYISKLHGLRKVSISVWSDEEYMGSALKGGNVIYSRKPGPNFIGVGRELDEAAFAGHISKTLNAAKGGHLEFIYRDVYTMTGDLSKPGRAVKIMRRLIEEKW
ncbi:MAG: hypothetical protein ACYCYI_12890 [Saccharofermentanales bacterium]